MTKKQNKRNYRRERRHSVTPNNTLFGVISSILDDMENIATKGQESNLHSSCHVGIPTDGTAVELPIPKGTEVFISKDGKPMIHAKVTTSSNADEFDEIYAGLMIQNKSSIEDFFCKVISPEQKRHLLAMKKLQLIAKYLNDGWVPSDDGKAFAIVRSTITNTYIPVKFESFRWHGAVAFKTEELAKRAIKIMGKQSLDDLFKDNI